MQKLGLPDALLVDSSLGLSSIKYVFYRRPNCGARDLYTGAAKTAAAPTPKILCLRRRHPAIPQKA